MNKKLLAYAIIPVLGFSLLGVGTASAHGFWGGNVDPEDMAARQQEMFAEKANILGISVDEIKNSWAEGKPIRVLAEEKGMDLDALREKMMEARESRMQERLDSLVQEGVITQEQAEKRLEFMKSKGGERGEKRGEGFHRGPGF